MIRMRMIVAVVIVRMSVSGVMNIIAGKPILLFGELG